MRQGWILLICLLISSCTAVSPPSTSPANVSWQTRTKQLQQLSRWKLNGKIAVQTAQDSGSATIDWSQNSRQYFISLLGPLGAGGLKLTGQPGSVTMQTADGKVSSASSPEQLLINQWGWDLPVSNLTYWVRGIPAPGSQASTQFDEYHRLSRLSQQGWHIQYLSYTKANGIELPQRMSLESPSLKAKMMIYNWNL